MWCEGVLGGAAMNKLKKPMWFHPKLSGFNPSERWGHSACFSDGNVYVFGGCCGGLHFSELLVLNVGLMAWRSLAISGGGPGPRDSHSSVLVGHKMIVFGGTNGSNKVNDLHILDLRRREWTQPEAAGKPPSPRESHTATLVGNDKMVIFGGSGEGEGNYLNDLHILDLKTMRWTSPHTKGIFPVPRDSHSAVSIDNKLFVYGGDCGDRYHGDVDILDMDTMTWSKFGVQGVSPGVRAGHGAVCIGAKVYVIGGVGDKHYYNDVWVLDIKARAWTQLDIQGQLPQGRFSHTAVVVDGGIAIYGGCGEDERPLNELLILQLSADDLEGRESGALCRPIGRNWNKEKRIYPKNNELQDMGESLRKRFPGHCIVSQDALQPKRRRASSSKPCEVESEQEEHSHSLSQNSSPSQSDHEQPTVTKPTERAKGFNGLHFLKQINQKPASESSSLNVSHSNNKELRRFIRKTPPAVVSPYSEPKPMHPEILPIGADVCGKVDGAFDSGYLVTATVNGKIFRGVLFAPGLSNMSRTVVPAAQHPMRHIPRIPPANPSPTNPFIVKHQHPSATVSSDSEPMQLRHRAGRAGTGLEPKNRSDLQGVVLTLGGPSGN